MGKKAAKASAPVATSAVQYQPVGIPALLAGDPRIDLNARYLDWKHRRACWSSAGDLYLLSSLHGGQGEDYSGYVISAYGRNLEPLRQAELGGFFRTLEATAGSDNDRFHASLTVLPAGEVVFSTSANRTYLFDPALEKRLGEHAAHAGTQKPELIYQSNFAYHIRPALDGRLACVVGELGVHLAYSEGNLVTISDGTPLTATHRPTLTSIGNLVSQLKNSKGGVFPYVVDGNGKPVGEGNRAAPTLTEQVESKYGGHYCQEFIHDFHILTDERLLVSLIHGRQNYRGADFCFALFDHAGNLQGRLEPIGSHEESPFPGLRFDVGVDRVHRQIVHVNEAAAFVFDFDGRRLAKLPLDTKELKPISKLALRGCSPQGELLFVHPEHHVLVRLPPTPTPADLKKALEEAASGYQKARNALKKSHKMVGDRFLFEGHVSQH